MQRIERIESWVQSPELRVRPGSGQGSVPTAPRLRLVEQDIYAELTRRRRRAQIAARRWVDGREAAPTVPPVRP